MMSGALIALHAIFRYREAICFIDLHASRASRFALHTAAEANDAGRSSSLLNTVAYPEPYRNGVRHHKSYGYLTNSS
jgi:hypothetical protein